MPQSMKEYYIEEIMIGLLLDARRAGSPGIDGYETRMKTVSFESLAPGDRFIVWVLGSEVRFRKIDSVTAESGGTAINLEPESQVYPAL